MTKSTNTNGKTKVINQFDRDRTYGLVLLKMNNELAGRMGLTTRACSFFFASASAAASASFFFAASSARAFAAAGSSMPGNLSNDAKYHLNHLTIK